MKKILLTLIALVTFTAVDAKVIKITMKDKTTKVFTSASSRLSTSTRTVQQPSQAITEKSWLSSALKLRTLKFPTRL